MTTATRPMTQREIWRAHKESEYSTALEEWIESWDTPRETECLATFDRLSADLDELDDMERAA